MEPTITLGQQVRYVDPETLQVFVALITAVSVDGNTSVQSLAVFPSDRLMFTVRAAFDEQQRPGTWHSVENNE